MTKTKKTVALALLALGICALAGAQGIIAVKGQSLSIVVKETQMRASPSFTGKVLATLKYGDQIAVLENKSGWIRAKSPDGKSEGWVNGSALTTKLVVIDTKKDTKSSVSGSEVALAGKGFNKEVEAQYKADGKVDYTWVDKAEAMGQPIEALAAFEAEGGVVAGGAE
jgi:hypothetical protein